MYGGKVLGGSKTISFKQVSSFSLKDLFLVISKIFFWADAVMREHGAYKQKKSQNAKSSMLLFFKVKFALGVSEAKS